MGTEPVGLCIIGDVGVDLVMGPVDGWPRIGTETIVERSELRAGGSGANTALAVQFLGGHSRLISGVGNDDWGRWLGQQLGATGAALHECETATTATVGLIDASGERTFFTTRGHLDALDFEHVRARLVPAARPGAVALLSGVFLTPRLRAAYPKLIGELAALGYEVALDTNWPPHGWDGALRREVAGWAAHCRHVLLNELEVEHLADTADLDEAIARLTAMLPAHATLVVKTGARGAIGVQDGVRVVARAPQTTVFDTIGAGDSFNAGYLLARSGGAPLAAALEAGCEAATAIIARFPRRLAAGGPATALPAALSAALSEGEEAA